MESNTHVIENLHYKKHVLFNIFLMLGSDEIDVIITAQYAEKFGKLSLLLNLTSSLKLKYISLSTKTCY